MGKQLPKNIYYKGVIVQAQPAKWFLRLIKRKNHDEMMSIKCMSLGHTSRCAKEDIFKNIKIKREGAIKLRLHIEN